MVTLHEAATRRQYERRIAQIQRDVLRLEGAAVRDLSRFLDTLRAQTLADLALVPQDGGWPAHRLSVLLTEIDEARVALAQRLSATLRDTTRQAWGIGETAQARALDVRLAPTALSLDQLFVAQSLHADLVRRVSDDFRARAARAVLVTVAGAQTPQQAMQQVGALLRTQPGRIGRGPIATQAERIIRTEVMTAFSLADQLADERLQQDVPGLRKWWDASGDSRTRPAHAAAERRYQPGGTEGPIPLDADFVVGGEKAAGPHDPRLSAKNRVNCRCVRMVWSPEWGT